MTALYLRQNATEDFIGAIFDVSQATISRRRTVLERPVTDALADLKPVPAEATRGDTVLVDGTLMSTSDWSDQGDLFSRKHHRTGMNVQVACTIGGTPWPSALRPTGLGIPELLSGSQIIADLGYLGIDGITTGTRRPPGGVLTDAQKTTNQSLAAIRAVIEQTIAHLKNWSSSTTEDPSTSSNAHSDASKPSTTSNTHTPDTPHRE